MDTSNQFLGELHRIAQEPPINIRDLKQTAGGNES